MTLGTGACTFENGRCGWSQDTTDDFDWVPRRGPTPSGFTGPTADHTVGTSKGIIMIVVINICFHQFIF